MRRTLAIAGAALWSIAGAASATVYDFSVVSVAQSMGTDYSYIPNYQFSIDDSSAIFQDNGYYFTVAQVATHGERPALGSPGGDVFYNADYNFYDADSGSGFDDGTSQHSYYSDPLFTGSTTSPTFTPKTYDLYYDPSAAPVGKLTISAQSAAPEPASWAMLIAGFGIAGGALRRKRPVAEQLAA